MTEERVIRSKKRNEEIKTTLTDEEALQAVEKLEENNFARSLVENHRRYNKLSSEQWFWVHKLALPKKEDESFYRPLKGIADLFRNANERGLKYPKIRLLTKSKQNLTLHLSGTKARFPRTVYVKIDDDFFGRIDAEGILRFKKSLPEDAMDLVIAFDLNPASVARLQGSLTDNCCFCGRALETMESVSVGYGPICAGKFGLPWGEQGFIDDYRARRDATISEVMDETPADRYKRLKREMDLMDDVEA